MLTYLHIELIALSIKNRILCMAVISFKGIIGLQYCDDESGQFMYVKKWKRRVKNDMYVKKWKKKNKECELTDHLNASH